MADHYEEEAEVEQFKRWWKENWQSLAAGLIIGFAGIFGWQMYQHHQQQEAADASAMYTNLQTLLQQHKGDEAAALGDRLAKDYAGSPYAAAAALKLAQQAVQDHKLDDAAKRLQWAMDHGSDKALTPLVRLRLAKVLWAQNKPDDALKLLGSDSGDYVALYDELRGDIKLSQGDRKAARDAYVKALADGGSPSGQGDLQRKLDDLADVVNS